MENSATITDAQIRYPRGYGQAKVEVKVGDSDAFEVLFSYYHDELSFHPNEFVGKTVSDARNLFTRKDLVYLRS